MPDDMHVEREGRDPNPVPAKGRVQGGGRLTGVDVEVVVRERREDRACLIDSFGPGRSPASRGLPQVTPGRFRA